MFNNESVRQQQEIIGTFLFHNRLTLAQQNFPKDAALSYGQELDDVEASLRSGASFDEVEIMLKDISSRIDQFSTTIHSGEKPSSSESSSISGRLLRTFSGIFK